MIKALALVLLSLSLIAGCGDSEYDADIKKICNSTELSGAASLPANEKAMAIATWLRGEIKSDKARKFMQSMSSMTPSARTARLRSEAKKAGLGDCPMADQN